ncbi:hypothetical protein B0T14DRAFT_423974 [Immersiella caudata]|uniref:Dicer-like protein 1 n=1 Tax=Immersiella caudata TaxID=314043 RepID=A0AA39X4M7_9PEZI|nr:hypothetical protein B0T14DRAFT_423974 [Immersiella caudata]
MNAPTLGEDEDRNDGDTSDESEVGEISRGVKRWIFNPTSKPRQISEKRRADNAAFDLWIEQNQVSLVKRSRKMMPGDDLSAYALVQEFENKKIISTPREYQLELFEKAKTQNVIAVLDTGSGKTLIAALLLRWTLQNEVEARARGEGRRIAFFLVDKVALVFQQHAVLTCNLDYPIEKLCGELVDGVESKDFWSKVFDNNMAIVCTADILRTCLHRSWIRIDQVSLLIFDEAHHTKKEHPYASIIKDFYAKAEPGKCRPRILGMTASPVDSKIAPERAAAELEGLLHSQIVTVSDPAVLQHTVCKPKKETRHVYEKTRNATETDLQGALSALVGHHWMFKKALHFARFAAVELGLWCVDRHLQTFFQEENAESMEAKALRDAKYSNASADRFLGEVRQARQIVESYTFSRPELSPSLLSDKVIQLTNIIRERYKDLDSNRRCIIFVDQRRTAMILADLFQQPDMQISGVRVGVLMGGGGRDEKQVSFRDQVLTILKFRRGELNCIFATSIAEEGLDIPDCNVIIRFDLYKTLIQYIQSRGRARQDGSEYIHMIERGNMDHLAKLEETKSAEQKLRDFCRAMPEDRKLKGAHFGPDSFPSKGRQFIVPITGAKLNYRESLVYLATFVAHLPHPPEVALHPEYAIIPVGGGFQCEVMLPSCSPVTKAVGRIYPSKAMAKCSAAFEMCLELIKGKYLDEHLLPAFTKQLPALRNARLAISSKKRAEYDRRIKPEIWSYLGKPTELYLTALTLAKPDALGRPSKPLALLTRQPIPKIAPFPLFWGTDRSSEVHSSPCSRAITVNKQDLESLTATTIRIFNDVFSKLYEASASELPYFIAPALRDHSFDFSSAANPREILDWETVHFVSQNDGLKYDFDAPDEFFHNKFVSDPFDGSRKFFLMGRRKDLRPTDPVPDRVVAPGHRAWLNSENHDIFNYSISLWSKSRSVIVFQKDQPVVEAELLPIRRNILDENIVDEDLESKRCFLILEPLRISPLPIEVVAMAYNFPAIIHRIESNLIALDACNLMGLPNIRPNLALEAFTKDSDNSDEHDAERINFQGGMGNNYERLEFLGDCFLKMATTISIFTQVLDLNEFHLHCERMALLCNQNLFNNALEVKLEQYVRSMAFNRRTWYPDGLTLKKGKRTEARRRHALGDKSIADVCEALIGAAYLTTYEEGRFDFDMAVRAVTAAVKDEKHAMTKWTQYYQAYQKPGWQTRRPTATQLDMARKFYDRLGYKFKYPTLLRSAFHHPSYPTQYENLPSYQRLEFLGDSLFDMVCIDYIFHRYPGADPQWLTEHKMAMVSNQFLGCLAFYLGFHRSILANTPNVLGGIADYATEMEEALRSAKEEAVLEGKTEADFKRNFWVNCSRPPKALPDVIESYIGAIFVDSEYDFSVVQSFFDRHVKPWFEDMRIYDTYANNHPINQVKEMMQSKFYCSDWRMLTKSTPIGNGSGDSVDDLLGGSGTRSQKVICGIMVHGRMLAHAISESSRYAKPAAAKKAVEILESLDFDTFRGSYGCDCMVDGDTSNLEKAVGPVF